MRELFLTPENVLKYQEENVWSARGKECIELHLDLNTLLDEELGDRHDWGGRYASWLNMIGLDHQTDQGYWNQTAIDKDNIELFVRFYKEGYLYNEYSNIASDFRRAQKFKPRSIDSWVKVEKFILDNQD